MTLDGGAGNGTELELPSMNDAGEFMNDKYNPQDVKKDAMPSINELP